MISSEKQNVIVQYLSEYLPTKIGIFGSYARDENRPDSDLDILIDIKKPISLFDLVKIQQDLSDLVGIKVDLVTERSIRNEKLKKYIEKDLKIIFH